MSELVKTIVLVPEADNSGRPFTEDDWAWLEQQLRPFGGWSVRVGVTGAWRSDTSRRWMRDASREVTVGIDGWTVLPRWLGLVKRIGKRFGQEAMYVEVAGIPDTIPIP